MKISQYVSPPSQPGQIILDASKIGAPAGNVATGRDLTVVRQTPLPVIHGTRIDGLADQNGGKDIRVPALNMRHVSPRKISEISHDLYTIGAIGWDEYEMLAFQPELHPDYNATIGGLTGEKADPDRPQDFIDEWEKKLAFERRYNPDKTRKIRQTEHLVSILRQIDSPTNLVA